MKSEKKLTLNDIEEVFSERKAGAEDGFKFFSVLVPLVEKEDGLHLLYEVRAKHMTRQPGEICFPGGELEAGETPEECAVRETWEEIGIPEERIRVVSPLDTVYTYSNFAMYCYLGVIDEKDLDDLKLNPDEVDEVFLVNLDEIASYKPEVYETEVVQKIPESFPYDRVTGGKTYNWRKGRSYIPVYDMDGRVIWGLTARITKRFVETVKERMVDDV